MFLAAAETLVSYGTMMNHLMSYYYDKLDEQEFVGEAAVVESEMDVS